MPSLQIISKRSLLFFHLALGFTLSIAAGTEEFQHRSPPQTTISPTVVAALAMPASPRELWSRLLKLLAEDHGYMPKERIETILGIRFSNEKLETNPPTLGAARSYALDIETEGLGHLRVSLMDDPEFTSLSMGWGTGRYCLSLENATKDLHRLGWVSGELRRNLKTGFGDLIFWLPDEAAYASTHGIPMFQMSSQGWSRLFLTPTSYQSDCLNEFGTRVWRIPLHQQGHQNNSQ